MYSRTSGSVRSSAPSSVKIGSMLERPMPITTTPSSTARSSECVVILCNLSRSPEPESRDSTDDAPTPTPSPTATSENDTGNVKPSAASGSVPSWPTKYVSTMLYELTAIRPTTIGAARSHRCRPIGPLTSRAVAGVRTASAPVLIAEAPVPYGRAGPVTAGRTTAGNRAPAARAKSVVGAQLEDEAAAGRKRRVVIAPAPIAGPGHGLERRLPEHVVRGLEH